MNRKDLKRKITRIRELGVFGTITQGELTLVGYSSKYDRDGQEDILELADNIDLLGTLYPELNMLDDRVMEHLESGLSSWFSNKRGRWML